MVLSRISDRDESLEGTAMSKRGRKRKDRRKGSANHGKRPNS